MAFKHKPNKGSLFKNDYKDGETDRDYQGSATIECPHCKALGVFWVSGWVNTTQAGAKYLGLAVNAKDEQPAPVRTTAEDLEAAEIRKAKFMEGAPEDDIDKDIPF